MPDWCAQGAFPTFFLASSTLGRHKIVVLRRPSALGRVTKLHQVSVSIHAHPWASMSSRVSFGRARALLHGVLVLVAVKRVS